MTDYCGFISAVCGGRVTEKIYSVYVGNKFFANYPATTAAAVVADLRRTRPETIAIDAETGEIVID